MSLNADLVRRSLNTNEAAGVFNSNMAAIDVGETDPNFSGFIHATLDPLTAAPAVGPRFGCQAVVPKKIVTSTSISPGVTDLLFFVPWYNPRQMIYCFLKGVSGVTTGLVRYPAFDIYPSINLSDSFTQMTLRAGGIAIKTSTIASGSLAVSGQIVGATLTDMPQILTLTPTNIIAYAQNSLAGIAMTPILEGIVAVSPPSVISGEMVVPDNGLIVPQGELLTVTSTFENNPTTAAAIGWNTVGGITANGILWTSNNTTFMPPNTAGRIVFFGNVTLVSTTTVTTPGTFTVRVTYYYYTITGAGVTTLSSSFNDFSFTPGPTNQRISVPFYYTITTNQQVLYFEVSLVVTSGTWSLVSAAGVRNQIVMELPDYYNKGYQRYATLIYITGITPNSTSLVIESASHYEVVPNALLTQNLSVTGTYESDMFDLARLNAIFENAEQNGIRLMYKGGDYLYKKENGVFRALSGFSNRAGESVNGAMSSKPIRKLFNAFKKGARFVAPSIMKGVGVMANDFLTNTQALTSRNFSMGSSDYFDLNCCAGDELVEISSKKRIKVEEENVEEETRLEEPPAEIKVEEFLTPELIEPEPFVNKYTKIVSESLAFASRERSASRNSKPGINIKLTVRYELSLTHPFFIETDSDSLLVCFAVGKYEPEKSGLQSFNIYGINPDFTEEELQDSVSYVEEDNEHYICLPNKMFFSFNGSLASLEKQSTNFNLETKMFKHGLVQKHEMWNRKLDLPVIEGDSYDLNLCMMSNYSGPFLAKFKVADMMRKYKQEYDQGLGTENYLMGEAQVTAAPNLVMSEVVNTPLDRISKEIYPQGAATVIPSEASRDDLIFLMLNKDYLWSNRFQQPGEGMVYTQENALNSGSALYVPDINVEETKSYSDQKGWQSAIFPVINAVGSDGNQTFNFKTGVVFNTREPLSLLALSGNSYTVTKVQYFPVVIGTKTVYVSANLNEVAKEQATFVVSNYFPRFSNYMYVTFGLRYRHGTYFKAGATVLEMLSGSSFGAALFNCINGTPWTTYVTGDFDLSGKTWIAGTATGGLGTKALICRNFGHKLVVFSSKGIPAIANELAQNGISISNLARDYQCDETPTGNVYTAGDANTLTAIMWSLAGVVARVKDDVSSFLELKRIARMQGQFQSKLNQEGGLIQDKKLGTWTEVKDSPIQKMFAAGYEIDALFDPAAVGYLKQEFKIDSSQIPIKLIKKLVLTDYHRKGLVVPASFINKAVKSEVLNIAVSQTPNTWSRDFFVLYDDKYLPLDQVRVLNSRYLAEGKVPMGAALPTPFMIELETWFASDADKVNLYDVDKSQTEGRYKQPPKTAAEKLRELKQRYRETNPGAFPPPQKSGIFQVRGSEPIAPVAGVVAPTIRFRDFTPTPPPKKQVYVPPMKTQQAGKPGEGGKYAAFRKSKGSGDFMENMPVSIQAPPQLPVYTTVTVNPAPPVVVPTNQAPIVSNTLNSNAPPPNTLGNIPRVVNVTGTAQRAPVQAPSRMVPEMMETALTRMKRPNPRTEKTADEMADEIVSLYYSNPPTEADSLDYYWFMDPMSFQGVPYRSELGSYMTENRPKKPKAQVDAIMNFISRKIGQNVTALTTPFIVDTLQESDINAYAVGKTVVTCPAIDALYYMALGNS